MTRYNLNVVFGSETEPDEARAWAEALALKMPEGCVVTLKAEPMIISLEDLSDEHAGSVVTIHGYFEKLRPTDKKKAAEQANRLVKSHNLTGVLERVYQTGARQAQRTLVIDGAAYDIPAYSLVELSEW